MVTVVRLGAPRGRDEGLRIGTVRRPPRGVPKGEYAARDFFDVWLPELAPSAELVAWALAAPLTPRRWAAFERRYRREMRQPAADRLLGLLAAVSERTNVAVGCYCEDEHRCHRAVLGDLLRERGAQVTGAAGGK